ncbi:uncharacterized protein SCHCODRAFT_02667910 [Schizophyllum commune H4-8]|uniref:uncharacterized protein n=1 Tax=Schizophyllum commune (strain H4-8 / FGSC 9210) TaxID=578458 RepID=UPI002160754D|nr:uncharacterized protein SCHCODRAFT_02667910 [Schizophyllum commune H4-8]KAI5892451.1 hypothetical protein SCHCODRAFT_02667910 [Schizophyllum commune H4-8]
MRKIANLHGIDNPWRDNSETLRRRLEKHSCPLCISNCTVFEFREPALPTNKYKTFNDKRSKDPAKVAAKNALNARSYRSKFKKPFPPKAPSFKTFHRIANAFADDLRGVEEAGCAVCGLLKRKSELRPLKNYKGFLTVLEDESVTSTERKSLHDPSKPVTGPVLASGCDKICPSCRKSITHGNMPRNALANNLWLGDVPPELQNLRYVERMLIQRMRHNACFIRVGGSYQKLIAHAVSFPVSSRKVYAALPPTRAELDEVLAVMYTGPVAPTKADYLTGKFNPILVRHNVVRKALEWLALNHPDYANVPISEKNLQSYNTMEPPVTIEYRTLSTNIAQESRSADNNEDDHGVESGEVPIVRRNPKKS